MILETIINFLILLTAIFIAFILAISFSDLMENFTNYIIERLKNKLNCSKENYLSLSYFHYNHNYGLQFEINEIADTKCKISEFKEISIDKMDSTYSKIINGKDFGKIDIYLIKFRLEINAIKDNGYCLYFFDEASAQKKYNKIINNLNS
jgi:hypothetical protein